MPAQNEIERDRQPYHLYKNIRIQAIPVSPSETKTPLQIVCFFDQSKNQSYAGGTEAIDDHFQGAIKRLRADDLFHGERFETLLLTPSDGEIQANRLLLLGLGNPDTLLLESLEALGRVIIQEAIKLDVKGFCFAPSLKDAGFSALPAGDVSLALIKGMIRAIDSAQSLQERKLIPAIKLEEIVFLAGLAHVESSQAGLQKALGAFQV
jgi:hypothetical protein